MRYPNHYDLKNKLIYEHGVDRMDLEFGSPQNTYRAALGKGVITQEEFDAAARGMGMAWYRAGD